MLQDAFSCSELQAVGVRRMGMRLGRPVRFG